MKSTAAAEDLIGSVKSVKTKKVSVFENAGEITERLESTSSCRFDERNNLIESQTAFDGYESKTLNRFDSQNRLIETVFYVGGVKTRREFSYDSQNRVVEIRYYDKNDNLQNTERCVYTKDNLRIEEADYEELLSAGRNSPGNIHFKIAPEITVSFSSQDVYTSKAVYDARDKLLEVSLYNRRKKIKGKIYVIYDSDGVPIQVRKFGDIFYFLPYKLKRWQAIILNKLIYLQIVLQNLYNLVIRRKFKNAGQCLIYGSPYEETNFRYNEQRKLIEIKTYSTINDERRTTFSYDEMGNKSEQVSYSGKDSFSHSEKHEYEYDARNNWIKRKTLYKIPMNVKNQIEERLILTYREINY